jgi:hypothetical protein
MRNRLAVVLVLVAGCSSQGELQVDGFGNPTWSVDDKPAFAVDCSQAGQTWTTCYETAGNLCKDRGFLILGRSSDLGLLRMVARCKDG